MAVRAAALSGDVLNLGSRSQAARPAVEAVLREEHQKVLDSAKAKWPVVTGRSRRGLKLGIMRRGARVEVSIVNFVPYAPHIRPKVLGGQLLAWDEYVKKPLMAAIPNMRARVARAALDALKRTHRG